LAKKDKKTKKKAAKKAAKPMGVTAKAGKAARKAGAAIAGNPAVAEVVAAALVGAAAALRNPKKARALANAGSERLEALGKDAANKGSALWALALEVGRKSLETLDLVPPEKAEARRQAQGARREKAGCQAQVGREEESSRQEGLSEVLAGEWRLTVTVRLPSH